MAELITDLNKLVDEIEGLHNAERDSLYRYIDRLEDRIIQLQLRLKRAKVVDE
jgi:hypothetical protein